jgi:hypothetical protein
MPSPELPIEAKLADPRMMVEIQTRYTVIVRLCPLSVRERQDGNEARVAMEGPGHVAIAEVAGVGVVSRRFAFCHTVRVEFDCAISIGSLCLRAGKGRAREATELYMSTNTRAEEPLVPLLIGQ